MDLPIPANDFETRKQQLFHSNNKIIDPIIHQQIFDILQEQIKHVKQSFDHIYVNKQQPKEPLLNSDINNELPNDTKELQDQVNPSLTISCLHDLCSSSDYQITFVIDHQT